MQGCKGAHGKVPGTVLLIFGCSFFDPIRLRFRPHESFVAALLHPRRSVHFICRHVLSRHVWRTATGISGSERTARGVFNCSPVAPKFEKETNYGAQRRFLRRFPFLAPAGPFPVASAIYRRRFLHATPAEPFADMFPCQRWVAKLRQTEIDSNDPSALQRVAEEDARNEQNATIGLFHRRCCFVDRILSGKFSSSARVEWENLDGLLFVRGSRGTNRGTGEHGISIDEGRTIVRTPSRPRGATYNFHLMATQRVARQTHELIATAARTLLFPPTPRVPKLERNAVLPFRFRVNVNLPLPCNERITVRKFAPCHWLESPSFYSFRNTLRNNFRSRNANFRNVSVPDLIALASERRNYKRIVTVR